MSASAGTASPTTTSASAAFAGALGRACAWFFSLLQSSNFLYSLKTFAAALLALYISFCLDLSQPAWALMTVYIVSQPLSGMVISKAIARVFGTLAGAVVAVVLVALFHDVQPLFVVSVAAWIGLCLYCSIQMRDLPGAYGAMLSGYTAAIIALTAIPAPETTFEVATTRCTEIIIGIICATLASRLVLPRSAGRIFRLRAGGVLADMKRCIIDVLRGHYDDARGLADLKKLIADTLALESLRIHAARDTADVREAEKLVRVLQGRLCSLSSLLISVRDRLVELRRTRPDEAAAFEPLFARVITRVETLSAAKQNPPPASAPAGGSAAAGARPGLTSDLLARLPDFEALRRDPELILEYNIILRLIDILAQWQEINRVGALLFNGKLPGAPDIPVPAPEDTRIARYRDHSLAQVAAFGAAFAVIITSAIWIFTGWVNGSSAVVFAGVVSCIAAQQDNPSAAALRTLKICAVALVWALVYLFAILPRLHGFDQLALAMAALYVPTGMLIPSPRYGPMAYAILIYGSSFMAFHNVMAPNFADILNSSAALMTGILCGVLGFRLLRPIGAEWAVRRHTKGLMADLATLAAASEPQNRSRFETRMLDRINALMLRLRMDRPDDRERLRGAFTALRVGLNIRFLLGELPAMPSSLAAPVRDALDALDTHFRELMRAPDAQPAQAPLIALDRAIHATLSVNPRAHDKLVNTLVCLRAIRATFDGHAAFYRVPPNAAARDDNAAAQTPA